MASRLELHRELEEILGSKNVYFQPPESKKLSYDCIVYNRSRIETKQANNYNYVAKKRYDITCIYMDPDSQLADRMIEHFQYCRHINHIVVDNLYHDVFSVFY